MAVTTAFVTDTDLELFQPDILTFGPATFGAQLIMASDDVFQRLVDEWWPQAIGAFYGLTRSAIDVQYPVLPTLKEASLDKVALRNLVCYRAISHYIMPLLASDADANGDLFTRRAARYQRFYQEEWDKIIDLPIYDFNQDTLFTNIERPIQIARRLRRA